MKNKKTNGETEFVHVVKKYINVNATDGQPINTLKANAVQNLTCSFEVKGTYRLSPDGKTNLIDWTKEHSIEDFKNLEVAVFIQDLSSKKVYQSAYSKKVTSGILEESVENNRFDIYPNPASTNVQVDFTLNKSAFIKLSVFNSTGQLVSVIQQANFHTGDNTVTFDVAKYVSGFYFVQLQTDNNTITKKLLISQSSKSLIS